VKKNILQYYHNKLICKKNCDFVGLNDLWINMKKEQIALLFVIRFPYKNVWFCGISMSHDHLWKRHLLLSIGYKIFLRKTLILYRFSKSFSNVKSQPLLSDGPKIFLGKIVILYQFPKSWSYMKNLVRGWFPASLFPAKVFTAVAFTALYLNFCFPLVIISPPSVKFTHVRNVPRIIINY
jgi:hypothetical protein